jgi:hypothetical protein
MAVIEGLTADELAAHAKGYGVRFDNYVDIDVPIMISLMNYAKLVAWCEPYMARRHEVQGAVAFRFDESNLAFERIVIERVYVMGGNSQSFRTTCLLDPEEMLSQMQADYPERTCFMSDEVGWWHLHPGQYPSLSVGDVEECRKTLRDWRARCTKILHLLMYGDPRGGYQLSGYLVGMDDVNRLPVRIEEI